MATIPASHADLLTSKKAFAHVVTLNPDGSPQVTPVWVDFDGTHVLVNTAKGRVKAKIVSKAEGAIVRLDQIEPSAEANEWAEANGKDPRVIEVILRESRRIVRMERGILIAETHHGFVCANAGVDASNVAPGSVTVLP